MLLQLDWTLPVMIVMFLVFAWLLNLVFFGPVTRVLAERQALVGQQQERANAALQQAQDLQADYERRLKAAHGQAQDAIQAAIKEAEAKRQSLLDGVKADMAKDLAGARDAIHQERNAAMATLQGEVGQFAELIKRKVVGGSPAYSSAGGNDA